MGSIPLIFFFEFENVQINESLGRRILSSKTMECLAALYPNENMGLEIENE